MTKVLFFFAVLILLTGCSNNVSVTSPLPEGKDAMLSKIIKETLIKELSPSDTIIILPKSHKTLIIDKKIIPAKIETLDNEILSNGIAATPTSISPMASMCIYKYTLNYDMQNQYAPVSCKIVGADVSSYIMSYQDAKNTYGFTKVFVYNLTDVNAAYAAGFSYDNMMFNIGRTGTITDVENLINTVKVGGKQVIGSYFAEEVAEKSSWDANFVGQIAQYIYPKKLFISSYKYPTQPCNLLFSTWGSEVGALGNAGSNVYIMCDQYHGDIYGQAVDYWAKFSGYYGSKNISNWVELTANNGDGNTHNI
jgi:uncharacterized protein YceK